MNKLVIILPLFRKIVTLVKFYLYFIAILVKFYLYYVTLIYKSITIVRLLYVQIFSF